MKIDRYNAQPNKSTFLIKPIKDFISLYFVKNEFWIDPFNGDSELVSYEYRNDLNPDKNTKYHLEANDFLKLWDPNSIDGIFLDPPYSLRQVKEVYNSIGIDKIPLEQTQSQIYLYKPEILRILKPNGKLLIFGWNTNCYDSLHFKIRHIRLINHGGNHNDTICSIQEKIQYTL